MKSTLDQYKYDNAKVHANINDTLRSKNESELEELPTKIIEIGNICQKCKVSKMFALSILPYSKSKINIKSLNKKLKNVCFRNNFIFINHQLIMPNDLLC